MVAFSAPEAARPSGDVGASGSGGSIDRSNVVRRLQYRIVPLAIALSLSSATLYCDTVVLRDGTVIDGKVLRSSEREVTIESDHGVLTFRRSQVLTVREGDERRVSGEPHRAAGEIGGRERGRRQPQPGASAGRKRDRSGAESAGVQERLDQLISELDRISLRPWEREDSHRATEAHAAPYKVEGWDGVTSFATERPASPDGIGKLWVRRRCQSGDYVFIGCFEWARLYWHEDRGEWLVTDPAYSAFCEDEHKVRSILTLISRSRSGMETKLAVTAGVLKQSRSSPEEREKRKSELRELTRELAAGWGGAENLYDLYLADLEVELADSPARKIEAAGRRRDLARQVVRRFVGSR
jgi:hypothetical protein